MVSHHDGCMLCEDSWVFWLCVLLVHLLSFSQGALAPAH